MNYLKFIQNWLPWLMTPKYFIDIENVTLYVDFEVGN